MKRVTINVTAEDIAKGSRMEPYSCPIALAARRAGFGWFALVGVRDIRYGLLRIGHVTLPDEARRFMSAHDGGYPVQPLSFEVTRS